MKLKIKFKDAERTRLLIATKGYTLTALSRKIGMCGGFLTTSLRNNIISPKPAYVLAEILKVDYNELFEVIK